jgi:hypothetical protein
MKRIKTLCIVLLVVFFGSMYQGVVVPFVDGIKYGLFIAKYELDSKIETDDFLLMDVIPKQSDYMERAEINLKTSENVLIRPNNISIIVNSLPDKPVWWFVLQAFYVLLSVLVIILVVWIPFLVVRILNSLQHSQVFDRNNLKRINRIGLILLFLGIAVTSIQFINVYIARYMVDLSNYSFSYAKIVDFNPIIMAIIILIMNEVMKVAIEIKEEQDLTI